ncbi:hypothetical protein [Tessaracoccus caeni]|uniref:hypothetical protein n=1 Tax=Tessaracoccus caeni TaxID=3031239 RepID=UPI0023D9A573|nr:hypothetical protein [Tessaracoccus caeni]MDF1487802.1 hypothetical protein [Tessaracoccus caeni]
MANADPEETSPESIEALVGDVIATGTAIDLNETVDGVTVPSDSGAVLDMPTPGDSESIGIGLPGRDVTASLTDEGAAVYEDIAPDTSLVVALVEISEPEIESAVQTLITIESAAAPSEYVFPLDLPEGAQIDLLPDGSAVVLNADQLVLSVIAAPWAVDATGTDVPTRFVLDGDKLIQEVDHWGATYPVVADPFWFVPVIVVGARAILPIVVRATTKKAAEKLVQHELKKQVLSVGGKVQSQGAITQVSHKLADGVTKIKPGSNPSKNGFDSFDKFKKAQGTPKKDHEWHHIVEQKHVGKVVAKNKGNFGKQYIHNPNNLVRLHKDIHRKCVNSIMGRKSTVIPDLRPSPGKTLRETIDGYGDFAEMHRAGIKVLERCGVEL